MEDQVAMEVTRVENEGEKVWYLNASIGTSFELNFTLIPELLKTSLTKIAS
jgi:hypothetical protein